jgi:hypothetical protein
MPKFDVGQTTERNNRTKTKIICEPRELYRFLATPGIELESLVFASDRGVWASWKFMEEEKVANLKYTNEVIGAYVTTGARIHLYKYLDRLQDKVLYCDTDSILYVQKESEPPLIETGDHLGAKRNELKTGEYIDEFVSGGPKNYKYRVCRRDASQLLISVCKVRGITVNYTASQLVNFDVIREMILTGKLATVNVHTVKKIKGKRKGCMCFTNHGTRGQVI